MKDNGSFKASNYKIAYTKGDFEIVSNDGMELTLAPYDQPYDGNSHGVTITKATAGKETVTFEYSTDQSSWQSDPIEYTDVTNGAKTVYVKASAKGYDSKTVSSTVTITPATITVAANNDSKKYG